MTLKSLFFTTDYNYYVISILDPIPNQTVQQDFIEVKGPSFT